LGGGPETIEVDRLLIDGKFVDARGKAVFENITPATEQVIGISADDLRNAIIAARRAFDESRWAENHARRATVLLEFRDALRERADEIGALIVGETGPSAWSMRSRRGTLRSQVTAIQPRQALTQARLPNDPRRSSSSWE